MSTAIALQLATPHQSSQTHSSPDTPDEQSVKALSISIMLRLAVQTNAVLARLLMYRMVDKLTTIVKANRLWPTAHSTASTEHEASAG